MSRSHVDHARHLTDRPRTQDGQGGDSGTPLARFLCIDRAQGLHPTLRALHARRASPPAEGRLTPFLRILRGHRA